MLNSIKQIDLYESFKTGMVFGEACKGLQVLTHESFENGECTKQGRCGRGGRQL